MVPKTAEQISVLEKENAEMKKRLSFIDQNSKIPDFINSAIWSFILWVLVSIIVDFAEYGSRAMAIEDHMSLLGAALLTSIVIIIGLIIKGYVVYLFMVSTITLFQSEIIAGVKKIEIFRKAAWNAGLNALRENKEKDDPTEDPVTVKAEPTEKPVKGTREWQKKQPEKEKTPEPSSSTGIEGHPAKVEQKPLI